MGVIDIVVQSAHPARGRRSGRSASTSTSWTRCACRTRCVAASRWTPTSSRWTALGCDVAADRGARRRHAHEVLLRHPVRACSCLLRAYPGRFHGLAGIDPSRGDAWSARVRAGDHASSDFVGAHLYPHWFELAPDHAKYYPFYAKCCELDVPIMMQIGHCLDYQRDRVLPSVGRPITLDRVAIDFPELKLIGIHQGWPWVEEMIAICFKHNNVYMCWRRLRPEPLGPEVRPLHQHVRPGQGDLRNRLAGARPRAGRP